jgi:hypothetical protein
VTDLFDRLTTALANRYVIERELGSGGKRPSISPRTSSTTARWR